MDPDENRPESDPEASAAPAAASPPPNSPPAPLRASERPNSGAKAPKMLEPADSASSGIASQSASKYVAASVAAATRRAYAADWGRFSRWCAAAGIDPLAAAGEDVARYVAQAADAVTDEHYRGGSKPAYAASTLRRWVTGLNQVHAAAGVVDPPGHSEVVRRTLAGIRRQRKTPPARRRPLHLPELANIVTTMQDEATAWPQRVAAARDAMILLVGHLGAFRGAELVALHESDIVLGDGGATVTVRKSKTDQEAAGATKALRRTTSPVVCPLCAWHTWRHLTDALARNGRPALITAVNYRLTPDAHGHVCSHTLDDSPTPEAPAIRWLGRHGWPTNRPVGPQAIARVVTRRATQAGMDTATVARLGAHSLRAGFVTDAYAAGASDGEIMRQTGHRSVAQVRAYQRDAPHVANAITRLDLA